MKKILTTIFIATLMLPGMLFATSSGGGYTLDGQISPISGTVSGGGYTSEIGGNPISGVVSGGGYTSYGGAYFTAIPTTVTPSGGGGGGGGGGGSTKVCPTGTTGVYPYCYAVPDVPVVPTTVPTYIPGVTLACTDALMVSKPVRYGWQYFNDPEDVKIVEKFLNTFENANIPVDGVYSFTDQQVVIAWQEKYMDAVLWPWGLTQGTGYVYTTSIAQMKRQQQNACTPISMPITCTEVLTIQSPVSYENRIQNIPSDVMMLERFLNTYENEHLIVDGDYSLLDRAAVIRWQEKYAAAVLTPWGLTQGTGYVYTTSMAQMKLQQEAYCLNPPPTFPIPPTVVTVTCPYFTEYATVGSEGPEVMKIQEFLNRELGAGIVVDGVYDFATQNAVKAFQYKYATEILSFWNLNFASGWWYKTTRKQANALLGCTE